MDHRQEADAGLFADKLQERIPHDSKSPYIASVWDNRYILTCVAPNISNINGALGRRLAASAEHLTRLTDEQKSSLVTAWDAQGKAYFDYSRYNMNRLSSFAQIDIRVDKTFYIGRCMLGCYLDIQNLTASKLKRQDVFMSTGVIQNPKAPLEEQHTS